jgi:hypothetical protein
VLTDAAIKIRRGSRFTIVRLRLFWRRLFAEAPTFAAEIVTLAFVAPWSCSLLMYGTSILPPAIAVQLESNSYFTMAIVGVLLAVVQLVAMLSLHDKFRATCSLASALWLGGLAGLLYAGDFRVPSALGYFALSFIGLMGYWKVKPRLFLSIAVGVVSMLRGRRSDRT